MVRAAFVLAIFGWGVGFYSPPVFLHATVERTGLPVQWVSMAVTHHFLLGAAVVAGLPRIHRRLGMPATTLGGAVLLASGVVGWAIAIQPWQLFVAASMTGAAWATMGAAAINAIVSPWFGRSRPVALAKAYNGASVGGVIFIPLWGALMPRMGFAWAAVLVGIVMVAIVAAIAVRVVARSPQDSDRLAEEVDSDARSGARYDGPRARPLPGVLLWRDRGFLTLAGAMALSLFAQMGLLAHLYGLLAASFDARKAGYLMALATGCAVGGRTLLAHLMQAGSDRRIVLCASYAVQMAGTVVFLLATGHQVGWIVVAVCLFGLGIGNATSLPPLIAQVEFVEKENTRVVALIVAISQGLFALAPAGFALLLSADGTARPALGPGTQNYFLAALSVQALATTLLLMGRRRACTQESTA